VPLECVWPLLSVGEQEGELDGTLTDGDRAAIETFNRNTERKRELAKEAAATKVALAKTRRDRVCRQNVRLLRRVEDGKLSRNSAVAVIRKAWSETDDGPRPCARTLNGWLAEKTLQDP
jgi:hypothetical protein